VLLREALKVTTLRCLPVVCSLGEEPHQGSLLRDYVYCGGWGPKRRLTPAAWPMLASALELRTQQPHRLREFPQ